MNENSKLSENGVFCNRTLNLKSIRAIGYDMDYTLVHYNIKEWEGKAYSFIKKALLDKGLPVEKFEFRPDLITRGLIIDTELGNLVKANRFGYIKKAMHGTSVLEFKEMRECYTGTLVDLSSPRYIFLNTFFSLSEACIYAQLVDLLDRGKIEKPMGYSDLYKIVITAHNKAHIEGELKSQIVANPERFIELDDDLQLTLVDQKNSGKQLLLITNSEWSYTDSIMTYVLGGKWTSMFDLVVVSARKPEFFTGTSPFFRIVDKRGLLEPHPGKLEQGGLYLGGSAKETEKLLETSGDRILYVGDHIYSDVHVTKRQLKWRTAVVLRELEDEILANKRFANKRKDLKDMMNRKQELESRLVKNQLYIQRIEKKYGPDSTKNKKQILTAIDELKTKLLEIDNEITPLAIADGMDVNENWGYLMRTGNEKSHLARQIEEYADIYTSRVSNFLHATPNAFFRAHRASLPHDQK